MGRLHRRWVSLGIVLMILTLGALGLQITAFGQPSVTTILVTTPTDVVAADGLCSVREAVQAANSNLPSGSQVGECIGGSENDRILFSPDFITFTLGISGSYEDANQSGDFDITDSVIIQGNGITETILDGGLVDRFFHVLTGTVRIESLAITNGRPQSVPYGAIPPGAGGAIYNEASLTLDTVALYSNYAADLTSYPLFEMVYAGHGGAIASTGDLHIQSGFIYSNTSGSMAVNGISKGIHSTGKGGAIYSVGDLIISDTHIFGNRTPDGAQGFEVGGFGGNGGAISAEGTVAIYSSRIENNRAGNGHDTLFPQGYGATGGSGGAIYAHESTTVTMSNTTLSGNRAGDAGDPSGGIGTTYSYAGDGGGIAGTNTSIFIIDSSTIDNNHAGAKGVYVGDGGGIYSLGTLTLTNSTVSANRVSGGQGSGIYANNAAIYHSTIAYNTTTVAFLTGGIYGTGNRLGNVILAHNNLPTGSDCGGTLISEGYNLILDTAGCTISGTTTTNIYGQDPLLAPLALDGGTTRTHAIDAASPALDAGNCFGALRDQRNLFRPVDHPAAPNVSDGCDMGAYERQDGVLPTLTPTVTPTVTLTPEATAIPSPTPTGTATPSTRFLFLPIIRHTTPTP